MVAKKKPRKVFMGRLDYLNYYQQNKLINSLNGKVVEYNMYENINNVLSLDEIKEMPLDKASDYIARMKELHGIKKLQKHWGITAYHMYNKLFPQYNIEVQKRSNSVPAKKKTRTAPAKETKKNNIEIVEEPIKVVTERVIHQPTPMKEIEGFTLGLTGSYSGEEVQRRIEKYLFTLNEKTNYKVAFSLTEQE